MAGKKTTTKPKSTKKITSLPAEKANEGKSVEVPAPTGSSAADSYEPWTPSPGTAFKLLVSVRMCAALWSSISDCDETYNYWEPAHFLKYGKGFQTWEYSPEYAVRSYAYVLLHVLPMKLVTAVMGNNTILVFYMTRCLLSVACAGSEVILYRGVVRAFGPNVSRLLLVILVFSAGMFISSSAFLPSSFSMYLTMLAYGSWYLGKPNVAVMCIAGSAIWGWPFAAALGIPIAFDLLQRRPVEFIKWSIISAVILTVPLILIDMHFYGKLVVAPLNIVLYNVFSGHGPELYGVEPLSYYIINGFLNFNFAFFIALLSLPNCLACVFVLKWPWQRKRLLALTLAPMYIWIIIFFTRPHKEERFLFPIYPFFALATALSLDLCQRIFHSISNRGRYIQTSYTDKTSWMSVIFSVVFATLCLSRIVALYQGYHAPLEIYVELHRAASDPKIHTLPPEKPVNVCVGKEWYRFPSSFFLPGQNWHLQFLQSEFKGQLPKPYGPGSNATQIIPSHMNDMNREEPSRYVDISRCHYIIDRDSDDWTAQEPNYSATGDWTVIKQVPFLDASRSHRFFRAFFVPFLSNQHCHYTPYNLLKSTKTKKSSKPGKKS